MTTLQSVGFQVRLRAVQRPRPPRVRGVLLLRRRLLRPHVQLHPEQRRRGGGHQGQPGGPGSHLPTPGGQDLGARVQVTYCRLEWSVNLAQSSRGFLQLSTGLD